MAAQLSKSGSVDYDEDFEIDDYADDDDSDGIQEVDDADNDTDEEIPPQPHSASFLQRNVQSAPPIKLAASRPITNSSPRDRSLMKHAEEHRRSLSSSVPSEPSRPKTTGAAIPRTRVQKETVNIVRRSDASANNSSKKLLERVNNRRSVSVSADPEAPIAVPNKPNTPPLKPLQPEGIKRPGSGTSSEMKTPPRTAASSSSRNNNDPEITKSPDRRMYDGGSNNSEIRNSSVSSSQAIQRSRAGNRRELLWIKKKQWRFGPKVGSGSFGDVFQGVNDIGKLFAVKRLAMTSAPDIDNLLSEIEVMKSMEAHQNIVQYLGADFDDKELVLYIFQEWVPGGSVAEMLTKFGRPFPIAQVRTYTRHILNGLAFLHQNEIVHRDIKGGNVLVDENGNAKIADFGCSSRMQAGKTVDMTTIKGTPFFMAPEVLNEGKYGRKGDVWAVGCTVIQMLTGKPPWSDKGLVGMQGLLILSTYLKELKGVPHFEWPSNMADSPSLRSLLQRCFSIDVERRSSSEELLTHEFLFEDEFEDSNASLNMSLGNTGTDLDIIRSKMQNAAKFQRDPSYPDLHDTTEGMSTQAEIEARMKKPQGRAELASPATVISPV